METEQFADIILPLAARGKFAYRVPGEFIGKIKCGSRVIVQFGNKKLYSGIVSGLHNEIPESDKIKNIKDILDAGTFVNETQLKLWKWISEYYMCTIGEVMKAALPSGLCLESDTEIKINPDFTDRKSLDESSLLLIRVIENQTPVYLKNLPATIGDRNTLKVVNELINNQVIIAGETLREKYKPKEETFITLAEKFTEDALNKILDNLNKAPRQADVLSAYLRLTGHTAGSDIIPVRKTLLVKEAGSSAASINSLIKKRIFVPINIEVGRLSEDKSIRESLRKLTGSQSAAFKSISRQLEDKNIALLHGVTSSGKTEIYIHLIEEQLQQGKQVLYLLPEIALTTQIINRLKKHFGPETCLYHSRFNDGEKVEIWRRVTGEYSGKKYKLILGARSSLFLPFYNLGLVIVDEEHDGSYKQHDPAPRYHARDSAMILAGLFGAKTVLGSATPSIESYYNAITGKYGLTELNERYGKINMPGIIVANTREAFRKKMMVSHFTPELLQAIDMALEKEEQVMLFRNRRGFSPYIECSDCGFIPVCNQCAVNLTYHKAIGRLVCHYCGYSTNVPDKCGNCGSTGITTRGFGTEKIHDEIKIIFPAARVARMDHDTTRSKNSFDRIIRAFEERQIDILIGTQMLSKGLDFENLTVVGILNADNMLNFPDFRAYEKGFQLMEQVSGRAGRRQKVGTVIIQTADPSNRIIRLVLRHDYKGMFDFQSEERKTFRYPPFFRLIKISTRHKDKIRLNDFSGILGDELKSVFGKRVLGPEYPLIPKIQLWFIKIIIIKIEREKSAAKAKQLISETIEKVEKMKGASSFKISVDVDPY
jgi:primosomal protein N' (replication factor Y) (superfamily II helicase)